MVVGNDSAEECGCHSRGAVLRKIRVLGEDAQRMQIDILALVWLEVTEPPDQLCAITKRREFRATAAR